MNLLEELKKIKDLSSKTKLHIVCSDGMELGGVYQSYISELDNEPEEAQLDMINLENNGLIGILESEILSIDELVE